MNSGFLNLNWDHNMEERSHLDASLSSILSSQPSHKIFGALQNMNNCGDDITLQSHYIGASVNSLPKVPLTLLEQFAADAGFSDRASRFSSFECRNYGEIGKGGSRQPLNMNGLQMELLSGESVNGQEEKAASDPASGSNPKKRKAPMRGKGKDVIAANSAVDILKVEEDEELKAKKFRRDAGSENEIAKPKMEQIDGNGSTGCGDQKQSTESNSRPPEPPKDYIHVRARRGQATDSHSLAERVRREKISQRMKLLQDLVPGCNKVTGKAVMLDEIINYVQSLQRQVEFLSMKLATVNPCLDFNNLANLFQKDPCGPIPNAVYPLENSGMVSSPYANQSEQGRPLNCILNGIETQSSVNQLDAAFQQNFNTHQALCDRFGSSSSQLENFWGDDLQNVVQMDIGQSQDNAFFSSSDPL